MIQVTVVTDGEWMEIKSNGGKQTKYALQKQI